MDMPANDAIALQLFNSVSTQTLIRSKELLQLQRMHTRLTPFTSDYLSQFGPVQLMQIVSKGYNKKDKSGTLYSWVTRRLRVEMTDPMFWAAARLVHDDQRMKQGEYARHGTILEVIQQRKQGALLLGHMSCLCLTGSMCSIASAFAIEMTQRSAWRPLEHIRAATRGIASMLPFISGRRFMKPGCGPMLTIFHHLTPCVLNQCFVLVW